MNHRKKEKKERIKKERRAPPTSPIVTWSANETLRGWILLCASEVHDKVNCMEQSQCTLLSGFFSSFLSLAFNDNKPARLSVGENKARCDRVLPSPSTAAQLVSFKTESTHSALFFVGHAKRKTFHAFSDVK